MALRPFNSIPVMSGQWESDNDTQCVKESLLGYHIFALLHHGNVKHRVFNPLLPGNP